MRRSLSFGLAGLGLLAVLLSSSAAEAQFSRYYLPIERGVVKSKIELQTHYSSIENVDSLFFGIAGRYNFGNLAVGLNIPFAQGWFSDLNDWQLGDIRLDAKYKVLGIGDTFGLAIFANFYLPTHSSDSTHEWFSVQTGAAASFKLLGFEVGGGIQALGFVIGDNRDDVWKLGAYGFARVPLLGLIAVALSLEYWNALTDRAVLVGDRSAEFYITPMVEASIMGIHAGIGTRIAVTDDARFEGLGRASLLINVGYSW
jgi:hypothetical protein